MRLSGTAHDHHDCDHAHGSPSGVTHPGHAHGHHDAPKGGHSHGHDHSHGGGHAHPLPTGPGAARKLAVAFVLIAFVLVVELTVAILSHSLALLADAGHVLTDIVAIGLSWFAVRQAERPPTAQRTYGYHRTGIMVALFNSATLVVIALFIAHEAWGRLFAPVAVEGGMMIVAALVGLVVNLWVGHDLSSDGGENLNVKSAVLHVMCDAAASLGVIVAAALMWWQPTWTWLDPVIAVLIAVLIGFGAWQIIGDSTSVLMEGAPAHIDMDRLVHVILEVPGVEGVHDLHVWSIASGLPVLTCHVLLRELDVVSSAAVLNAVRDALAEEFKVHHCTLQPEWELCGPENLYCTLDQVKRAPTSTPASLPASAAAAAGAKGDASS